jgi:hypothetical protein
MAPTSAPVISSPDELSTSLIERQIIWYGVVSLSKKGKIMALPEDNYGYDSLSTDNQYLVYKSQSIIVDNGFPKFGDDAITILNIKAGEKRVLVSKTQMFPDAVLFAAPTFTPDGKNVIFVVAWENTTDLVKVDLENGKIQQLNVDVLVTNFGYPNISPQGQIIVICKGAAPNAISELCLLDENGKFIRYLTSEKYPWPGYGLFTPDGQSVVYESRYKLYKVRIDGSERQQIAPCGSPILVTDKDVVTWCHTSQKPACYGLFIASLDGKDFRRIGYIDPFCEK